MTEQRSILHVDMDAFYASVEQRDDPALAGRPVVVGGTPQGRGVVAAASYEARRYGLHSAMPASTAARLCPRAVFLPVRMAHYAAVSRQIHAILERYTPLVEPLSLDEAFLDVTASRSLFGPAEAIARQIKREIREELRLVASVGVAPNKFLAKLASDLDKPDGFVSVRPEGVQAFLDPLPVGRLWGVGKVAGGALARQGLHTIADLRARGRESLVASLGRAGGQLWELAHGRDDRPVVPDHAAKSISHETTFPVDVGDREMLRARLSDLTGQVARRLRRQDLAATTVQLKLRYPDFRTLSRARTLARATDVTAVLWRTAAALLEEALAERPGPLRLLGMGVTGLQGGAPGQADLFAADACERERRVDATVDEIRERFGSAALRRGTELAR